MCAAINAGRAGDIEPEARRFAEGTQLAVAFYFHALALAACGRHEGALIAFNEAVAKGYDPAWALYNRAQCLLSMGRFDEAEDDLAHVRRLNLSIAGIDTVQRWIDEARRS